MNGVRLAGGPLASAAPGAAGPAAAGLIDAADAPDLTAGAAPSPRAPGTGARDRTLHPPGEWHGHGTRVSGEHPKPLCDGAGTPAPTDADPARNPTGQRPGPRDHGADEQVSFRTVRPEEPPAEGA
ncbi:hypothetical protein [Streptomyces sulfonofaciens]|uniref:hypothetical protein n=1 Tax=Streptomyces sulfonofaciens TaxID=68272 RepID=UPI0016751369|nr:hypothetical protein [Streptomyces sulfonofaciens]